MSTGLEDTTTQEEMNNVVEEEVTTEESTQEEVVEESSTEDIEDIEEEKEEELDEDTLSQMDDEEFLEYFNSNKIPDRFKGKNTPLKPTQTGSKIDENKKDDLQVMSEEKEEKNALKVANKGGINYQEVYDSIFKPFKANGKEITPRSVEDVLSLMQMGANYTKKMQVIAPMKKQVESLNKANISEEDLNFLIDIHKGDKEAIKKLLEKHKVDPLELDMEGINYVPNKNIVSDEDIEFSNTLDDISESIPKIQEILNKQWDSKSKKMLFENPRLLQGLHEEIQMGRFDQLQQQLELEKTLGRYKGKTDLEAYIDLATKAAAQQQAQQEQLSRNKQQVTSKSSKPIPDKSKAAPTRSKPSTNKGSITAEDILSMSDEDIERMSIKDLV